MRRAVLVLPVLLAACTQATDIGYLPGPTQLSLSVTPVSTPGTVRVTVDVDQGVWSPNNVTVFVHDGAASFTMSPLSAVRLQPTPTAPWTHRYTTALALDPAVDHLLKASICWAPGNDPTCLGGNPVTLNAGTF
ncbi:hypothetical protein [uncultured Deinococcus sp.]|uniref:hypothetical protein n=1 Tax=uncultured Deinococcus sp. TaxID=158789 RepID=UPI0025CBB278|nr:hypothetical protein [uncultured Deinococcus sp.]